jgi:hypothetical protein
MFSACRILLDFRKGRGFRDAPPPISHALDRPPKESVIPNPLASFWQAV